MQTIHCPLCELLLAKVTSGTSRMSIATLPGIVKIDTYTLKCSSCGALCDISQFSSTEERIMRDIEAVVDEVMERNPLPSQDVVQYVTDYAYVNKEMGDIVDPERVMDIIISQRVHMNLPMQVEFLPAEPPEDAE